MIFHSLYLYTKSKQSAFEGLRAMLRISLQQHTIDHAVYKRYPRVEPRKFTPQHRHLLSRTAGFWRGSAAHDHQVFEYHLGTHGSGCGVRMRYSAPTWAWTPGWWRALARGRAARG